MKNRRKLPVLILLITGICMLVTACVKDPSPASFNGLTGEALAPYFEQVIDTVDAYNRLLASKSAYSAVKS